MGQALRLAGNPRVSKLASDPRLMNAAMKALSLGGTLKSGMDRAGGLAAGAFGLATQQEVANLRATIRNWKTRCPRWRPRRLPPGRRLRRRYAAVVGATAGTLGRALAAAVRSTSGSGQSRSGPSRLGPPSKSVDRRPVHKLPRTGLVAG